MTHLFVCVRLHGAPVEERLLPVQDRVWLGDNEEAGVCFPGANLWVTRVGEELHLRGRRLRPGERVTIALGPVDVDLEAVRAAPRGLSHPSLDPRLLVAAAALILSIGFADAVTAFVEEDPVLAASWPLQEGSGEAASAARSGRTVAKPPGDEDGDGELSDTGTPPPHYPSAIYVDVP